MPYEPMPMQVHLDRGYCCNSLPWCVFCPYRSKPIFEPLNIDPRIEAALRSGEETVIYSDRMSLIPIVKMQNLTIIYKPYEPK